MLLILRRGVATRAKKIPVQLLKDWPRLGKRGEVVDVSEGMMRNKLHANNGAAYVLKGQPLRIPLYIRPDVETRRPTVKSQPAEKKQEILVEEAVEAPTKEQPSVIDFLKFPGSQPTESAEQTTAEPAKDEPESKKFEWENDIVANISKNRRS